MTRLIPERYAGLVAFGIMYLWVSTILLWVEWTKSESNLLQIIGFAGAILASVSGLAIFFYTNGLESELKDLKAKNSFHESQANEWKEQAQCVIDVLEKERSERRIRNTQ